MTNKLWAIVFVVFAIEVSVATAIQCDFKYIDDNDQNLGKPSKESLTKPSSSAVPRVPAKKPQRVFDCEDPLDDFEAITDSVGSRVKPSGFDTRFGEDEYESAGGDCVSIKKKIQPKALNTIYNKLMTVVNNSTYIQLIDIETCQPTNEVCNSGGEPPIGKKLLCRQKHVTITLTAQKDDGTLYDEQFYYPSHCICELVQKKRSVQKRFSSL